MKATLSKQPNEKEKQENNVFTLESFWKPVTC